MTKTLVHELIHAYGKTEGNGAFSHKEMNDAARSVAKEMNVGGKAIDGQNFSTIMFNTCNRVSRGERGE
ncbi:MAG: hypothetical protein ACK5NT_07420 [Pyrinomonadaceae bacterium]